MPSSDADLASPSAIARYEAVIGLEDRAQLATATRVLLQLPEQPRRAAELPCEPCVPGLVGHAAVAQRFAGPCRRFHTGQNGATHAVTISDVTGAGQASGTVAAHQPK